ncbi:MAG: SsrA-binding protein SmpB [Myxococcota bacterium]
MARDGGKTGGGELLVCRNPKATQRFEIEERLEAGMVLVGSEVKSLRQRRADLEGAYASIDGSELWLHGMHIAPYPQAGPHLQHEPKRRRKLLVHRHQIERLRGKLAVRGYTLVPVRVYFKGGRAKVELGLGKGKRLADRREEIKRKQDLAEAREAVRRGKRR